MPFDVSEVIEVLVKLSEEENLRITVVESVKGAATAGVGALIGGVIAGPIGLAVGAAAGGVIGATQAKTFKPLATVIIELPAHKKEELARRINKIVSSVDHTDAIALVALVQSNTVIRSQILESAKSFFGSR